jgi:hypothetical protein
MNESEDGAAIMLAKQAVVIDEPRAKLGDFSGKRIAAVGVALEMRFIVVDVHFDIAYSKAHHLRNAFNQIVPIVFLRVEEAVLRALVRGIPRGVIGNARPLVAPARNAIQRRPDGLRQTQRLVMICDGNPDALRLCGPNAFPQRIFQVGQ